MLAEKNCRTAPKFFGSVHILFWLSLMARADEVVLPKLRNLQLV